MIRSFGDSDTEKLVKRIRVKRFGSIERAARRKLGWLQDATSLGDLALPGLRLEKLSGSRQGQCSIRENDQYRICFEWKEDGAYNVELTDYH